MIKHLFTFLGHNKHYHNKVIHLNGKVEPQTINLQDSTVKRLKTRGLLIECCCNENKIFEMRMIR